MRADRIGALQPQPAAAWVVGDDNPVNIVTTLSAEERRLGTDAGLTAGQVRGIHRTASEVAFTDESTRAAPLGRFASEV